MIRRGHLTLLSGNGNVPLAPVTSTSPHRLVTMVVQAAQQWAIEVDRAGGSTDAATPEELARRDLLDAVFTLEWHQVAPDREDEVR